MPVRLDNKFPIFPQMTKVARLALAAPFLSQIVFDLTELHYYYWDGVQWVEF
jgi:hypothetical protein